MTFDPERDLTESFRRSWILNREWWNREQIEWNKGDGLKYGIKDVETPSWANLPTEQQEGMREDFSCFTLLDLCGKVIHRSDSCLLFLI